MINQYFTDDSERNAQIAYDVGKKAASDAMKALFQVIDLVPARQRLAATVMATGVLHYLLDGLAVFHDDQRGTDDFSKAVKDIRENYGDLKERLECFKQQVDEKGIDKISKEIDWL